MMEIYVNKNAIVAKIDKRLQQMYDCPDYSRHEEDALKECRELVLSISDVSTSLNDSYYQGWNDAMDSQIKSAQRSKTK